MSENTLEDEIDLKMVPDDIPVTDTDQDVNQMETDQVSDEMDLEPVPGQIDKEHSPDEIETEQVSEDTPMFDKLIEKIKVLMYAEHGKDGTTDTESSNNHQPITTTVTHSYNNQSIPVPPESTPILVPSIDLVNETNENITSDAEMRKFLKYKNQKDNKKEAEENDALKRIVIVKNVLNKCREMTKDHTSEEIPVPLIQRLHFFTKESPDYLAEVLKKYKPRNKSVKQAVIDTEPIPSYMNPIINNDIRDVFVEYYLKKKQVPTKKELLESLQEKGSNKAKTYYRNIKLRTLVKNKLVIYHDIPKLNRYILIENPEFAYQRNKYLRHVTMYRQSGAKFIYVADMSVESSIGAMTLTLVASPTAGLIGELRSLLPTVKGFGVSIKYWLSGLLPSLDPTAIIILVQPGKKDTTPTLYSTKSQMMTWLMDEDIHTEFATNKCYLYQLVKLSKNNKDAGFYDEIFTSAGFKVIVSPIEYQNLNYFNAIHRECACTTVDEFDEAEKMVKFMKKMSKEDWVKLEEVLIEEEKEMMKEDREMETMIENIFEMIKNGDVEEDDFPEGCVGDRSDSFDVHIGDIIID